MYQIPKVHINDVIALLTPAITIFDIVNSISSNKIYITHLYLFRAVLYSVSNAAKNIARFIKNAFQHNVPVDKGELLIK